MQIKRIKRILLFLYLSEALYGQAAKPTLLQWTGNIYAQDLQARGLTGATATATSRMALGAHNLFLSANFPAPGSDGMTTATIDSVTDAIAATGNTYMEANVDMNLFVSNASATLTAYDAAYLYAASQGLQVKLDATYSSIGGSGQTSGPSNFTQSVCNGGYGVSCVTANSGSGTCSVATPCFATFADFQAFVLNNPATGSCAATGSCPLYTMLTRWGASGVLGSHLASISYVHEFTKNTCPALNNNWTSASECTAANWLAFMNAAVTMTRAISGASCGQCATMDVGFAFASSDTSYFTTVCAAGSTITYCDFDFYTSPVNTLVSNLTGLVTNFFTDCHSAAKKCGFEETVPQNWVPNNSPQAEGNGYYGGANRNWQLTDQEWAKTIYQFCAAQGAYKISLFDVFKIVWYTNKPSCPNGPQAPANCSAPDATCGVDGTQCLGDISTSKPYIDNAIAQLNATGAAMTPFGRYWRNLALNGLNGAQ